MTTEARIEANRRNAEHSTGPRTAEGKAIARHNAITHGLLSAEVCFDDDKATFATFAEALRVNLAPVGELEGLLADRVIANAWRLRRAMGIERQVLTRAKADAEQLDFNRPKKGETALGLAFIRDCNEGGAIERLSRYETTLERGLMRAMHELERLQARRQGAEVPLPAMLDVNVTLEQGEANEAPTDAA